MKIAHRTPDPVQHTIAADSDAEIRDALIALANRTADDYAALARRECRLERERLRRDRLLGSFVLLVLYGLLVWGVGAVVGRVL